MTSTTWLDPVVPAHLRRISLNNNLVVGNMNVSIVDQYKLIKAAFEDNYSVACSGREQRMFPPLPETDLNKLADNQLYFLPSETMARRPPSHRDNNLPDVKKGLARMERRVPLTANNIELLKNDVPGVIVGDPLSMTPNKNFIQSYLNNIK